MQVHDVHVYCGCAGWAACRSFQQGCMSAVNSKDQLALTFVPRSGVLTSLTRHAALLR